MTGFSAAEGLRQVPQFLEAIGRGGERVAFTAYGGKDDKGDGVGNWHYKRLDDGTAGLSVVDAQTLAGLAEHQEKARKAVGHQLGFYCGRPVNPSAGGSRIVQLLELPCLKVEFDSCSKEEQLGLYREFEHTYGVKFTLLETGGKSVHAYLRLDEPIPAKDYKTVCSAFHERMHEVGVSIDFHHRADASVAGEAQTMRLPGAIHRKTGRVAHVLQFGEVCSLDDIELDAEALKAFARQSQTQTALAHFCQEDRVLEYSGDEALDILISAAAAWEKRVPGAGTYAKVVPLVGLMNTALGAEAAAKVLYQAGHNDAKGEHSLDGLLAWCQSFPTWGDPAECKARILYRAERDYGWKRPVRNSKTLVATPTVVCRDEDQLNAEVREGGGLYSNPTGTGKTKATGKYFSEMVLMAWLNAEEAGRESKLSAAVISPRVKINEQIAAATAGVNVSDKPNAKSMQNLYICCVPSLGNPKKVHGDRALWNEFYSYGDLGRPAVKTGRGMPAAAFLGIDEFRQTMEMLLLSTSGSSDALWRDGEERKEAGLALIRTMRNAIHFYGLDAQAGSCELEAMELIRPGGFGGGRVVTSALAGGGRTFRWTDKQNAFKAHLLHQLKDPDRTKPVLAIVGGKGKVSDQGTRGLSAWALKRFVEQSLADERGVPLFGVEVLDSETKDLPPGQKILNGDMSGVDLVLATPVVQSGFSFIGEFHHVGFVAGGETMPPNVTGGQAPRRERTLKDCIAYVPSFARDRNIPFETSDRKANLQLMVEEHQARYGTDPKGEELILLQLTAAYAERYMNEMALFVDHAVGYAALDGWTVEALGEIKPLQKRPQGASKKEKEVSPWQSLSPMHQWLLETCYGHREMAQLQAKQDQASLGSIGIDLITANAPELAALLIDSGLAQLCDGKGRLKDDPAIIACGMKLQSEEGLSIIRRSGLIEGRLGQSKDPAGNCVKAIGTVVRALGGTARRVKNKVTSKTVWLLPRPSSDVPT